jgi:hypothetical protein
MRSPADPGDGGARVALERTLRVVAVAALLFAIWRSGQPTEADRAEVSDAVETGNLSALATALAHPDRRTVLLALDHVPLAGTRALLHAARDAGVVVGWEAAGPVTALPARAVGVSALSDPAGGAEVRAVTSDSAPLLLSDSLGWLDSTVVRGEGATWPLAGEPRPITIEQGGTRAVAVTAPAAALGRLRVFASPGWEARFAVQALEEAGWSVDAEFAIAPRVAITAGAPAPLDTARYAAVIALDSAAWRSASAIVRYARMGGGVVLFPEAADGPAFAALRAGRLGTIEPGIPGGLRTPDPQSGLALRPVERLTGDAVVLEARGGLGPERAPAGDISLAARRVGLGRVLTVGWASTWEWRMLGDDGSVVAHRDWWRRVVQRVAYRGLPSGADAWSPFPGDGAPLADLVARLGPAGAAAESQATAPAVPSAPAGWLFVLAAAALLAEWWSRRLRGAR